MPLLVFLKMHPTNRLISHASVIECVSVGQRFAVDEETISYSEREVYFLHHWRAATALGIPTRRVYLMHTQNTALTPYLLLRDCIEAMARKDANDHMVQRGARPFSRALVKLMAASYILQRLYLYSSGPKSYLHGFQRNMVMLKLGNSNAPSPFHSDSLIPTFSVPAMFVTSQDSPAMEYTWTLPEDGFNPVTSTF